MLAIMVMSGLAVVIVAIMHAMALRITVREEMRLQEDELLRAMLHEQRAEYS